MVLATTPKAHKTLQGKGEASGQTSSQEQGHLHTTCVPNTAAP